MTRNSKSATAERELTRSERAAIRRLVTDLCANYDRHANICLPLDGPCYMLQKWWTGNLCKYFRNAVLPTDPALEASITNTVYLANYKECSVCGKAYVPVTSQAYCSDRCRIQARRKAERERKRRARQNRG